MLLCGLSCASSPPCEAMDGSAYGLKQPSAVRVTFECSSSTHVMNDSSLRTGSLR